MLKITYVSCLSLSPTILSKCVLQPKIAKKFNKTPFLRGSGSFRVISVDKSKKPVTSACYGVQHVCAYLQPFSRYMR